ncbi:MAG: hypothetical protein ABH831_00140 [Candidatus Nealsonbacteria bacterium]
MGIVIGIFGLILLLTAVVILIRFSVYKVKPDETAIIITGGVPRSVHGPGFCFVLKLPGNTLKRIPSKEFFVSMPKISIYTPEAPDCKRETILVSLSFRVRFPRDARLIDVDRMGVPANEAGLLNYFGPVIKNAAMTVLSSRGWAEALDNANVVMNEINTHTLFDAVVEDFINTGGQFQLIIEGISTSDTLKSLIAYENQIHVTTQVTMEIVERKAAVLMDTVIQEWSKATGWSPQEVQTQIRQTPFLAKQLGDHILFMAKREGENEGHFWDGENITSFHVSGSDRNLQSMARALMGGQSGEGSKARGDGKGDKTINMPDGNLVTLSAEDRKARGLSY